MAKFSEILSSVQVRELACAWLKEDVPSFDFAGLVVGDGVEDAVIVCKKNGILAGIPFVDAIFRELGCDIEWLQQEGVSLFAPIGVANVRGPAKFLLQGERVALNILSRASGVATEAYKAKKIAESHKWCGEVAGTRKTTPGFRLVEKYGLLVGGASQHRNDLSSMVMLKDNHIWTAGDVKQAVEVARKACGFSMKIEVECRSYDEAYTATVSGADIVMLDNFEPETAKSTARELKRNFPHLTVEVSGGISHETMSAYLSDSIDVISMSSLTQGYPCIDFSMKIIKEGRDPINPIVKFTLCTSSSQDSMILTDDE